MEKVMNKILLLENAHKELMSAFDEYAQEINLESKIANEIKLKFEKEFLNKKLLYFFENKLSYLNEAFHFASYQLNNPNYKNLFNLMYFNKNQKMQNYEQFI
jgi:hypothetical protein